MNEYMTAYMDRCMERLKEVNRSCDDKPEEQTVWLSFCKRVSEDLST